MFLINKVGNIFMSIYFTRQTRYNTSLLFNIFYALCISGCKLKKNIYESSCKINISHDIYVICYKYDICK